MDLGCSEDIFYVTRFDQIGGLGTRRLVARAFLGYQQTPPILYSTSPISSISILAFPQGLASFFLIRLGAFEKEKGMRLGRK